MPIFKPKQKEVKRFVFKNGNLSGRGFSLLEMIIYITILVFLLVVVMTVLSNIVKSQRAFNASKSVQNSALTAMERITREIREAQSISTASSTFGINPGVLYLEGTDIDGNPRAVEFTGSSNTIKLKENNIDEGALTKSDSRVTNLVFTMMIGTSSRAIRTQMTIESGTSTNYRSSNFYSTTILRGSL